jgi:CRP/FNR family transcriptional regulator, nitrogen fixation regulation protein
MEGAMFVHFTSSAYTDALNQFGSVAGSALSGAVAASGQLDALLAFEQIGSRRSFGRNQEIFAEGDATDCWFKVVSGAVRLCKLLADGRRHIAEFYFAGECFGLDNMAERLFSAEAVSDALVMRYPRRATERLIDQSPILARGLRDVSLQNLVNAQIRMMMLGRMNAHERVAGFLLDLFDRLDADRALDLPMMRNDIADHPGLTIETVCRTMSDFKCIS